MRVLFDTNVVLDLLQEREPFCKEAENLFSKVEIGDITGVLCATTITTIHYLLFKSLSKKEALKMIRVLLDLFEIATVNKTVLIDALKADDIDYEDSVLYKSAYHNKVDVIVTRDVKGFKKSDLPVYTPKELIKIISKINL